MDVSRIDQLGQHERAWIYLIGTKLRAKDRDEMRAVRNLSLSPNCGVTCNKQPHDTPTSHILKLMQSPFPLVKSDGPAYNRPKLEPTNFT